MPRILSETHHNATERIENAVNLLSQQVWCWGRDILRPEGNWLLKSGFSRTEPPKERPNCSSLYTLDLPSGRWVVLRAFGVIYGDHRRGGVFLPRYDFRPRYTKVFGLDCPPWTSSDLPRLYHPTRADRDTCVSLTLELIDWIRSYEVEVVEQLGVEYRRATLQDWDDGSRKLIPAECVPSAWRSLSFQVADYPETYCEGKVNGR